MGPSSVRALFPWLLLAGFGCTSRMPPPGHDDVLVGHVRAPGSLALPTDAVVRLMLLEIDTPDVPDHIKAFEERP